MRRMIWPVIRSRRERGVTALVVALVLVVLVSFAALAVDIGGAWWNKKQLQNGADAGALALAQGCAQDLSSCPGEGPNAVADGYATRNKLGGDVPVGEVIGRTATSITVQTRAERDVWFSAIFPGDPAASEILAAATASWGPIGGASTMPLTMHQCIFREDGLDKPEQWMRLLVKGKGVDDASDPCTPSGTPHIVPGGFHWLDAEAPGVCTVHTDAGDWADGDTGAAPKNQTTCSREQLQQSLLNAREGGLLIPMYTRWNGATGAGAQFQLVGYASFKPVAWCLNPKDVEYGVAKCSGDTLYLDGYFIRTVELGDATSSDTAPDFGTQAVRLTA